MKMKKNYTWLILISLLFVLPNCTEEAISYEDPLNIKSEEFTFIPTSPKTSVDVSLVYFGCSYNETSSVTIEQNSIVVKKHFNGAMKRPCIIIQDTISLGRLDVGNYQVTLEIIDINPIASDSIFSTETKTLTVSN
jgi:hypothetical protein